jgi:uncharacterized protein YhbP (UPF0306 family)
MNWREFLSAQTTLTLATTNTAGSPHVCDLFFAHTESTFYFLSDPKTRHVQNFLRDPRVSATIHGASQGWQDIRGVQIVGAAMRVDEAIERVRGFALYIGKFPFVASWLASPEMLGHAHEKFGVIELYKIVPSWLRWIDNAQGFGYKEEFEFS